MNKKITPFIGNSNFAREMDSLIKTVSQTNASVLLIGERGTGKRLIAQNIHFFASQNLGYFFEINCKSFSNDEILASFNTVSKIAAYNQRITLFVASVDEMLPQIQDSFLALIKAARQKGQNLKIICSTEKNLEESLQSGKFSGDLFYQLNTVVLNVLPLRQRKEDILPIADFYFNQFRKKSGYAFEAFSDDAKKLLENYFWGGNTDELINAVQRGFIVGQLPVIKSSDLGIDAATSVVKDATEVDLSDKTLKSAVDSFKKEYVTKILEENNWNQTKTAAVLGIQRTYVIRLINELEIRRK